MRRVAGTRVYGWRVSGKRGGGRRRRRREGKLS